MAGSPGWKPHVVMLLSTIAWAGAFSFIAIGLRELTPLDLTVGRLLVAAGPFALVLAWKGIPRLDSTTWGRVLVVAMFAVVGFHLAVAFGQTGVGAGVTALVTATAPVWTVILASAGLGERLTKRKIAGVLGALAGVAVLVVGGGNDLSVAYLGAALLVLLAPILWATASVDSKPALGKCDPLCFTALAMLIGTLPVLAGASPDFAARVTAASPTTWLALAFLGGVSTFLGNAGFFYALRDLSATATLTYTYLQPVFAVGWAFVLLGEGITLPLVVGGVLVVAGVVLTNLPGLPGRGRSRRAHSRRSSSDSRP